MARINNAQLTLTTAGNNVTITVTYSAVINALERFLKANGLGLVERIAVIGVDPPGSTPGTVLHNFPAENLPVTILRSPHSLRLGDLHNFPAENLPVTAGGGSQTIARNRSIIVSRASLQEEGVGDDDEIRCRITIDALNLPADITAFTDQEVLVG
jgi:hypothetical protein